MYFYKLAQEYKEKERIRIEKQKQELLVNDMGETCPRCAGKGRISRYSHYYKGACFKCDGAGIVLKKEYERQLSYVLYKGKTNEEIRKYWNRLAKKCLKNNDLTPLVRLLRNKKSEKKLWDIAISMFLEKKGY